MVRFLKIYCWALCLFVGNNLYSQIESTTIYPFLNQAFSGRSAAHGNYGIAHISGDVNQGFANPAFLISDSSSIVSFSNQFHFLDTKIGNVAATGHLSKLGLTIMGGFQYANYGSFEGYDIDGNYITDLQAKDFAFTLGASKQIYDNLRLGANMKFITSNLANYSSNALGFDLGAAYHVPGNTSTLGLALRNIGFQLTPYHQDREPMPIDLQAFGSIRLKHLPLRLGLVAHHLHRWNLLYVNPYDVENSFSQNDPFAKPNAKEYGFVDNLFRHLIIQSELSVGKKEGFIIRLAYNHFKKRDMTVNNFRSLAGFSGGLGLKVSKFRFDYGLSVYHIGGSSHTLTLSTDLHKWKKRTL